MTNRFRVLGKRPAAQILYLALLGVILFAATVEACNVPVFRYALEHWQPDAYRVTLLHRGALTDDERTLIEPFLTEAEQSRINVVFRKVDVDNLTDEADRKLFEKHDKLTLPGLVVEYPKHLRIEAPVSTIALSLEAVAGLMKSPVRSELVRRLADGQTAVWLLLESGQSEADDATAVRLEEELRKLEQKLKLPELTDAPEDALLTGAPLRVAFSLLRVPRGDSAEQALVAMLVNSESDLAERSEAMLFPVFGRGRALLPLVGPGITAENIHSSAGFLVGPCSCQVKDLNPGFDLLLAAEWESLLATGEKPAAATTRPAAESANEPELVAIPSGASPPTQSVPSNTLNCVKIPTPASVDRDRYVPQVMLGVALLAAAGGIAATRAFKSKRH